MVLYIRPFVPNLKLFHYVNIKDMEKENLIEYYKSIIETSLDCIKLFDLEGNLFYINEAGIKEHNLGSLEEALKQGWKVTDCTVEEDKPKFLKAVGDSLNGSINMIEISHTKDGSDREICLETVGPVRDSSGKIIGTFGTSRDISEIKKSGEILKEKISELERMNKLMAGRELKMIELKEEIERLKNHSELN